STGSDPVASPSPAAGRVLSAARRHRLRLALTLLRDARTDAQEFRRDPWEFAVGIQELLAAGLTGLDLRWLAAQGCVAHGLELTEPAADGRSFQPAGNLAFGVRTSFIVTDQGLTWLERWDEPTE